MFLFPFFLTKRNPLSCSITDAHSKIPQGFLEGSYIILSVLETLCFFCFGSKQNHERWGCGVFLVRHWYFKRRTSQRWKLGRSTQKWFLWLWCLKKLRTYWISQLSCNQRQVWIWSRTSSHRPSVRDITHPGVSTARTDGGENSLELKCMKCEVLLSFTAGKTFFFTSTHSYTELVLKSNYMEY